MSDILFERRGGAGIIILNRPKALNAVTHGMVRALAAQLHAWEKDDAVTRVVLTAAEGRAFSAGGDIRELYELGRAGRQKDALVFFREEYTLNTAIKRFRKPYVSLIDGIVMGGGAGLSIHGSYRVAGDRYQFAMPEVGIGFFPDVGATYALPRLRGEMGAYCALTAERLNAQDGRAAGSATHYVRSERFGDLLQALCGPAPVDTVLAAYAEQPGDGPLAARSAAIDRLFAADRVEDVLSNLDREAASGSSEADWAAACAAGMRTKSPLSLKIALAQMRWGKDKSFEDCMRMEYRIVSRLVYGHDLYEGVRAVIIDKDNAPRWQPDCLSAVSDAEVERHFAPLGSGELEL
jgi:enoyl-CoA hydratase